MCHCRRSCCYLLLLSLLLLSVVAPALWLLLFMPPLPWRCCFCCCCYGCCCYFCCCYCCCCCCCFCCCLCCCLCCCCCCFCCYFYCYCCCCFFCFCTVGGNPFPALSIRWFDDVLPSSAAALLLGVAQEFRVRSENLSLCYFVPPFFVTLLSRENTWVSFLCKRFFTISLLSPSPRKSVWPERATPQFCPMSVFYKYPVQCAAKMFLFCLSSKSIQGVPKVGL